MTQLRGLLLYNVDSSKFKSAIFDFSAPELQYLIVQY